MHALDIIHDRQARAVFREYHDALADGNDTLAARIRQANPDLAEQLAGVRGEPPRPLVITPAEPVGVAS
jgi:hypothetical protein